MTRDELEAVIWNWLRYIGEDRHGAAPAVVDEILKAADKYAAARYATAMNDRAAELHAARTDIGRQPTYGTARRTA